MKRKTKGEDGGEQKNGGCPLNIWRVWRGVFLRATVVVYKSARANGPEAS